jgi:hypothetical protein
VISGFSNARYPFDAAATPVGIAYDGDNSPQAFSLEDGPIQKFVVAIPNTTVRDQLVLRLNVENNSTAEAWAIDDVRWAGSTCAAVPGAPTFSCDAITPGSDPVDVTIPYTGSLAGYSITINPPLSFTDNGSAVIVQDAIEGQTYTVTITDGTAGCTFTENIEVPSNLCAPPPQVLITEVHDPLDVFNNRFVEVCNRGTGTQDISGWTLRRYANGQTTFEEATVPASTLLAPGECFVFDNTSASIDLSSCVASVSSGFISGNGDDVYELTDGNNPIDVYGVVGQDGTGEPWEYEDAVVTRNESVVDPSASFSISEWTIVDNANTSAGTPCIDATVLPIRLVSFTASAERETVSLNWITATERDNDYMAIERSADGREFSTIGRVEGAGSTDSETSYTFADEAPLPGRSYYRLRQVDFDGTTEYHGPIAVDFAGDGTAPVRIFPNPVAGDFVTLDGELRLGTQVTLLDAAGRSLRQWTIQEKQLRRELPAAGLTAGVYFLRLEDGGTVRTVRFVKQ